MFHSLCLKKQTIYLFFDLKFKFGYSKLKLLNFITYIPKTENVIGRIGKNKKQAGAELCQAQVKLEVVVEVEFGVEVEACHY